MNAILCKTKRSFLLVTLFLMGCLQLVAQTRTIQGEVTDAQNGEALIGATVMVEGEKGGTVTDFDGNFKLQVTSSAKKVKISYIGYIDKVIAISDNMKVKLEPESQSLGDVVVIGYGTARKSDLTGSVATVNSKDFNKGLVSSPEQLINGKVSGVQIMSNSGSASAGSTIRVRGGASLNASNDPLIVLDGVPLEQGGISGNSSNFLYDQPCRHREHDCLEGCFFYSHLWFSCFQWCHHHYHQERSAGRIEGQLQYHQQCADSCSDGGYARI